MVPIISAAGIGVFPPAERFGTSRGEVSQGSGTTASVGLCADLLPARVAYGLSTGT